MRAEWIIRTGVAGILIGGALYVVWFITLIWGSLDVELAKWGATIGLLGLALAGTGAAIDLFRD